MKNAPLFFRTFLVDFIETSLGLIFALNLIVPDSVYSWDAQSVVIASAMSAAVVSAGRRALPGFSAWLRVKLAILPVKIREL